MHYQQRRLLFISLFLLTLFINFLSFPLQVQAGELSCRGLPLVDCINRLIDQVNQQDHLLRVATQSDLMEQGLLYFPFDNNLNDAGRFHFLARKTSETMKETFTNDRKGQTYKALLFSSAEQSCLELTSTEKSNANLHGSFTLGAWVKVSPDADFSSGGSMIVAKHYTCGQRSFDLSFAHGYKTKVRFTLYNASDSAPPPSYVSGEHYIHFDFPADGGWHLVIGSYDYLSGKMMLFLDGELKQDASIGAVEIKQTEQTITIGCYHNSSSSVSFRGYFNGGIDDVFVLDRAVSESWAKVMSLL
ncbi:MAG: LamG domain-containing protein [Oligoflexia bacterium]|nr:LamG domain-containing protein [Oligoflexia bacterium]MBF0365593.1 LamG domain-containing protein [Oligoflexia bacterium]